jgi:hypothetical protein
VDLASVPLTRLTPLICLSPDAFPILPDPLPFELPESRTVSPEVIEEEGEQRVSLLSTLDDSTLEGPVRADEAVLAGPRLWMWHEKCRSLARPSRAWCSAPAHSVCAHVFPMRGFCREREMHPAFQDVIRRLYLLPTRLWLLTSSAPTASARPRPLEPAVERQRPGHVRGRPRGADRRARPARHRPRRALDWWRRSDTLHRPLGHDPLTGARIGHGDDGGDGLVRRGTGCQIQVTVDPLSKARVRSNTDELGCRGTRAQQVLDVHQAGVDRIRVLDSQKLGEALADFALREVPRWTDWPRGGQWCSYRRRRWCISAC